MRYLAAFDADFTQEDRSAAITHLCTTDYWTSGKMVDKFERTFGKYVGRHHSCMTNSGSSALFAAIYSMGWTPGSRIIVPAVTFPTAVSPLLWLGLVPVLVDVDDTLNIDPQKMLDTINSLGSVEGAIIPHTLGNPVDPDVWGYFSKSVEDCCDALGSTINNQNCGTFGEMSCFSFYPAHHITTIEGGMVLARSSIAIEKVRQFVNWGRACYCRPGSDNSCGKRWESVVDGIPWDHKYEFTTAGGNFKPGFDIQGVIGLAQLGKEGRYRAIRKRNHRIIAETLRPLEDVIDLARELPGSDPSWFGFAFGLKHGGRNGVVEKLEASGVGCRFVFGGNMARQGFLNGRFVAPLPLEKSDGVMKDWLVVGCNQTISEEEAHYIGNTIAKVVKG
jgi:CDP-6-deoxy-D-xylo-4-hexulose-3-dehydrase